MTARRAAWRAATEFAAHPRFAHALALVTLFAALVPSFVRSLVGWPGEIAILCALVLLAGLSLVGQWPRIEWRGLPPVSLMLLAAWMLLSVAWSEYTRASAAGVAYAAVFAALGVYLALGRDLIQLVRAAGDALRAVLVISFALEILSGLLIDTPIHVFGILGHLDTGGPIQGIAGSRNHLGFLCTLGVVTFLTELRTRSASRVWTIGSLVLAVLGLLFTRSPVSFVVLLVVGVATLVLYLLRRTAPATRQFLQLGAVGAVVVAGVLAWTLRAPIVAVLNAASEFETRARLWSATADFVELRAIEGWGWIGPWNAELLPYRALDALQPRPVGSALNAFLDAALQIGLVGASLLAVAFALALARSWLVASDSRITTAVWPALTLVLLGVTSLAQSYLLFEGGLMLFVTCAVAAARVRSWRQRISVGA